MTMETRHRSADLLQPCDFASRRPPIPLSHSWERVPAGRVREVMTQSARAVTAKDIVLTNTSYRYPSPTRGKGCPKGG